jgi:ParB family chromosome partitioning protein
MNDSRSRWVVFPEQTPPKQAEQLADQIERDGGRVLAIFREPLGEHWQIFSLLPIAQVEPTPYQRDLSPAHVKRLLNVVKKIDRFVDPIVVMSPRPGGYWTPNGSHRLAVMKKLKAKMISAIVVPEHEVAFQILALNTEKAHNLKEKSLEVIRMYRGLIQEEPSAGEEAYAFQFEAAHFITLGMLYESNKRFAGGAYAPILRRVDEFLKGSFRKTLPQREERADLVRQTDALLTDVVAKVKKRGINHPYVKNYVLARTTPLTRQRKTLPSFEQTFKKLMANLEAFDISKVRYEDIQRSAVMAGSAPD